MVAFVVVRNVWRCRRVRDRAEGIGWITEQCTRTGDSGIGASGVVSDETRVPCWLGKGRVWQ